MVYNTPQKSEVFHACANNQRRSHGGLTWALVPPGFSSKNLFLVLKMWHVFHNIMKRASSNSSIYFSKVGRVEGESVREEGQESGSSSACSGSRTSATLPAHGSRDLPNDPAAGCLIRGTDQVT